VERAESWRWSSLRRVEREDPAFPILSTWPLPRPTDWLQLVNQPQTEAEVAALHRRLARVTGRCLLFFLLYSPNLVAVTSFFPSLRATPFLNSFFG